MSFFKVLFAKFVFYSFKFFGIVPITYSLQEQSSGSKLRTLSFKTSRIGILWNVLLMLFIVPMNYVSMRFAHETKMFTSDQQVAVNETVFTIFSSIVATSTTMTLFLFAVRHSTLTVIGNKICKIRAASRSVAGDKKKVDFFDVPTIIYVGIFIINFVTVNWLVLYYSVMNPIYTMTYQLNVFIILSVIPQYTLILKVLKDSFTLVNDTLRDLLKLPHFWSLQFYVTESMNVESKINKLSYLYSLSYDLSQSVSSFYSLPMTWTILDNFILLLLQIFIFFKNMFEPSPFNADYYNLLNVLNISLSFMLLMVLTIYVTNTIKESKKTAKIVHDCLKMSKYTNIENIMKQFLDNLQYEHIEFSVYGFFSLDESFLMSLVGTLVTYLVILVQFNISGKTTTDSLSSEKS